MTLSVKSSNFKYILLSWKAIRKTKNKKELSVGAFQNIYDPAERGGIEYDKH